MSTPRHSLTPGRVHVARGYGAVAVPAADGAQAEGISPLSKISAMVRFEARKQYFLVLFHDDVMRADAEHILLAEGMVRIEHPDLLPSQWLVEANEEEVHTLTEWDEVAYVFPASAELAAGERVVGCIGPVVETGPVAQYVSNVGQGWDGAGQGSAELTFSITNATKQLPLSTVEDAVQKSLDEWSQHAAIRFRRSIDAEAFRNLNVVFASGSHGDSYPFDGRGGVLAHTYYPAGINPEPIAGDVHLDDDETWVDGGQPDIYSVVLHEVGHALGLGHSDRPGSVMYPYYRHFSSLQPDDIAAIQRLYAAEQTLEPAPAPAAPPTPAAPPSAPAPATPAPATPAPSQPSTSSRDNTAPVLVVTSPSASSYVTSAASLRVSGTAKDNVGVDAVTWQRGSTGAAAEGTTFWAFEIPLLVGNNSIVIRAHDAAGNTSWRSIVVTRK